MTLLDIDPQRLRLTEQRIQAELNKRINRKKQSQRGGLIEFVRYFWDVLEPTTPLVEGWPLDAVCEHLEAVTFGEITRLLINVPPGFMKSMMTDVMWPAWEWGPMNMPSTRYVTFSYAATLTQRDNGKFRDLLTSQKFKELWGSRLEVKTVGVERVSNDKTGWKFASSVGGVGTGERGDRVICFPYETKVLTSKGSISIGEIVSSKADVLVSGYVDGKVEPQRIFDYQSNPGSNLIEVVHERGRFQCTPTHPVFVVCKGYVPASTLQRGDILQTLMPHRRDTETSHIIYIKSASDADQTYNLNVGPHHNYFADGVLVHNCDDGNNVKEAESETVRNETNRWFRESMQNRLNNMDKSAIVVIAQRVHEDDISGLILSSGMDYTHLMIPMSYEDDRHCETEIGWSDPRTEDGELAWPERFPVQVIDRMQHDLGPYAYAGQYQQAPVPRGGGIFKREWWQVWEPKDGKFPTFDYIVASLDSAFTEKEENDPSGMTVWGVWTDIEGTGQFDPDTGKIWRRPGPGIGQPKVMLIKAWRKHLEMHGTVVEQERDESYRQWRRRAEPQWGLCEWVAETCRFRNAEGVIIGSVDKLLIEGKASGMTAAQEMQRLYGNDGWVTQVEGVKGDKVARAHSVVPLFSNGLVYAPDKEFAELVIDEMAVFNKGRYDDLTDSTTMCLRHFRALGLLQRKEDIESDIMERSRHRKKSMPLYPT